MVYCNCLVGTISTSFSRRHQAIEYKKYLVDNEYLPQI